MSQAKANTIRIQTTVSLYSIIDNSCYISLVSCLFFRYLTDNNTYFNESVVRWSNCEQFYLQIDHHLNIYLYLYTGQLLQLYYQTEDNYHHNGCIIDLLRSMIKLCTLYHSFRLLHRCPKPRLTPSAFKQQCPSIVSSIILALSHWYLVYFFDIIPIIILISMSL